MSISEVLTIILGILGIAWVIYGLKLQSINAFIDFRKSFLRDIIDKEDMQRMYIPIQHLGKKKMYKNVYVKTPDDLYNIWISVMRDREKGGEIVELNISDNGGKLFKTLAVEILIARKHFEKMTFNIKWLTVFFLIELVLMIIAKNCCCILYVVKRFRTPA